LGSAQALKIDCCPDAAGRLAHAQHQFFRHIFCYFAILFGYYLINDSSLLPEGLFFSKIIYISLNNEISYFYWHPNVGLYFS
jgi:hypothetical protein